METVILGKYIVGCFARSFDKDHVEKELIHLVCKVGYLDKINLRNYIRGWGDENIKKNEKYIFFVDAETEEPYLEKYGNNITLIVTSLDCLLRGYYFNGEMNNDLLYNILGSKYLKGNIDDVSTLESSNITFIFCDYVWSTIILYFKMAGIIISGGSVSKRHIFTNLDFNLGVALFWLSENTIGERTIYEMSKNPVLNNKISLSLFSDYTEKENDIINLNIKELNEEKANLFEDNEYLNLLFKNYKLAHRFIINNIEKDILNKGESIEKKIKKVEHEISSLSSSISKYEYYTSPSTSFGHLRNKDKKEQKKLKTLYLTQPEFKRNYLSDIAENDVLNNKLSFLKKELDLNKSNLNYFIESYPNYSLLELQKIAKEYFNSENKKISNLSKFLNLVLKNEKRYNDKKYGRDSTLFNSYRKKKLNLNDCLIRRFSNYSPILTAGIPASQLSLTPSQSQLGVAVTPTGGGVREWGGKSKINRINGDKYKDNPIKNFPELNMSELKLDIFKDIPKVKIDKISKKYSNYFNSIKDILISNNSYENKQKEIEENWFRVIESFYKDKDLFLKDVIHSTYLKKLVDAEHSLNNYFKKNNNIKKKFPLIYTMLNDFSLLLITFVTTIYYININSGYTNISKMVGNKIIQFLCYQYNKNNKNDKISFNDFLFKFKLDNSTIIRLGDFYLTFLTMYPSEIFIREIKDDGFNSEMVLKILEFNINEIKDTFIIDSFALPMVAIPNKWDNGSFGGYFLNKDFKEKIVTGSSHHGHTLSNKGAIYNTINTMSSTKFRINKGLLNFIKENPYLLKKLLKNDVSKNIQNIITLSIADIFDGHPIYIPLNCDWRGRIYTMPFYTTFQGNEISLSLLEFYDGETLSEDGLNCLYIYGANVYNANKKISKDNFANRIDWVKKNMDNILNMDKEFISKAENIFLFIAFCLTVKGVNTDPKFKVRLPVFLDATCNGLQHIAALMRDADLGKEVNLTKQDVNSKPQDIYSALLPYFNEIINSIGKNNSNLISLSSIKLNRELIKKLVMTKPYNATIMGMAKFLMSSLPSIIIEDNNLKKKIKFYKTPSIDGKEVLLSEFEIKTIASIIFKNINTKYPAIEIIYNYFIAMANLSNKLNVPVTWITPAGVTIFQIYYKFIIKKIAITLGKKTKKMVLNEPTKILNKRKQSSALIPNIIHSLDAAHVYNIISKVNNKFSVITVHDCFGTHPNNLTNLSEIVKLEFINIYSQQNFLLEFHNFNLEYFKLCGFTIKEEINNLPNYPVSQSHSLSPSPGHHSYHSPSFTPVGVTATPTGVIATPPSLPPGDSWDNSQNNDINMPNLSPLTTPLTNEASVKIKYIQLNNKKLIIPQVPKLGSLNLQEIRYSQHIIT